MPFVVKAQERLTITYDANDGTGRTRVITYSKGNSYTIAGNDIFNSFTGVLKKIVQDCLVIFSFIKNMKKVTLLMKY